MKYICTAKKLFSAYICNSISFQLTKEINGNICIDKEVLLYKYNFISFSFLVNECNLWINKEVFFYLYNSINFSFLGITMYYVQRRELRSENTRVQKFKNAENVK